MLWVDGFPCIVSVLGSCCLRVGLCQLLSSMLINVIISSYIHPHSPTFAETISAEIHLMPPPAFTAVISAPPGQSSSSSAEVCTALLHLSQVQGTPGSLPKRWSPWLGMLDLTQAGIEPQNCRTAVWHYPLSYHWIKLQKNGATGVTLIRDNIVCVKDP